MLKLSMKNISTLLSGFMPTEVYAEMNDTLSYDVLGAEFSEKYASGQWDGKKRLFNRNKKTFPTGLVGLVTEIFSKYNLPYELEDLRQRPKVTNTLGLKPGKVPRKYQLEAVQKALIYGRGIIEIATGGGKSFVIAMITAKLGLPTIIYVNTKDLLYQMIDDLKAIDISETQIGQMGDSIINPQRITVATVQTVFKAFGVKYPKYDQEDELDEEKELDDDARTVIVNTVRKSSVMIIDETQFLGSDTFQLVANNSVNSYYRYGASATPIRTDNADIMLRAACGKKILKITASELIDMGYLTAPDIVLLDVPRQKQPEGSSPKTSYPAIYKLRVTENEICNDTIVELAECFYKNKMSILILVQHIAHGETLLAKLKTVIDAKTVETMPTGKKSNQKIKDIEFLKGKVVTNKRKRIVALFREEKVKIMIATALADCGLNIPALDVLIMAGRGKSITRIPQRIGRVLRIHPGKKRALVFDFMDHSKYLRVQSLERKAIYESEPRFRIHNFRLSSKKELQKYLCQLLKT